MLAGFDEKVQTGQGLVVRGAGEKLLRAPESAREIAPADWLSADMISISPPNEAFARYQI